MASAKYREIPVYTKTEVDEWRRNFLIVALITVILAFCLGYIIGHFSMDDILRTFD